MRYKKTHPWLTFQADFRRAGADFWMLLGEAASKCEHLAGALLQPETAQRMHRVYLAKGAAATTAIEGNTLTEDEVLRAVDGTLEVPPSREYLKQEVDNVIAACNAVLADLSAGRLVSPSPQWLLDVNRRVLEGLRLREDVVPGAIRTHGIVVGNVYRGPEAADCAHLVRELCAWLSGPQLTPPSRPGDRLAVGHALLRAVIAHLYLAWIHPFGDGNGRTARLLEFHILMAAGVPSPAAHLLSNHYNGTRAEYYRQLDMASKSGGDIVPFVRYALEGFVDGLRAQLAELRRQQWQVLWGDYVRRAYPDGKSAVHLRQQMLAVELAARPAPVELAKLPELSPALARSYGAKTTKTVQRDVNLLVKKGLLVVDQGKARARLEVLAAFLPPSARD